MLESDVCDQSAVIIIDVITKPTDFTVYNQCKGRDCAQQAILGRSVLKTKLKATSS